MNFQKQSWGDGGEPEINLTPLIDAMFLLVIFFAVSTTFRIYPGLSVNLPTAGSEQIQQEEATVRAIVTEEGEIYLDGEKVARDQLPMILRDRQKAAPIAMFVLQADTKTQHGCVVEVMDAAKQAGIARLAIATRQKGGGGAAPGGPVSDVEAGEEITIRNGAGG